MGVEVSPRNEVSTGVAVAPSIGNACATPLCKRAAAMKKPTRREDEPARAARILEMPMEIALASTPVELQIYAAGSCNSLARGFERVQRIAFGDGIALIFSEAEKSHPED